MGKSRRFDEFLEQSKSNKKQNTQKTETSQRLPTSNTTKLTKTNVLSSTKQAQQALMSAALAAPITPFDACKYDFGNFTENSLLWDDFQPGKQTIYNLRHFASTKGGLEEATQVFRSLKSNLTNINVCKLLLLAYNLKDNNGDHVFAQVSDQLVDDVLEFEDLPTRVLAAPASSGYVTLMYHCEGEELLTAYCYLAASYLRLYTKSVENYGKLREHLRRGFTNFFSFAFPLDNYHPDPEVVAAIKKQFDTDAVLKNTFYALIYAGESTNVGKDLKTYLYVMHTTYTGMHCYGLFLRCLEIMKLKPEELAVCFQCKNFDRELQSLLKIMSTLHNSSRSEGREKQMWRFARIFDKTFAAHLQTKNSTQFTAILAVIYHRLVPPTGNQDARKIAKVKEFLQMQGPFCEFYARRTLMSVLYNKYPDNYKSWFKYAPTEYEESDEEEEEE